MISDDKELMNGGTLSTEVPEEPGRGAHGKSQAD
jgi:hypothetical protein